MIRVRAYGPGVEPTGPVVGAPANFTVETFSAGKGNVEVIVEDPRGQKIAVSLSLHNPGGRCHSCHAKRLFHNNNNLLLQVEVKFNNDRNLSYSCSYKPQMEGVHRVTVSVFSLDVKF